MNIRSNSTSRQFNPLIHQRLLEKRRREKSQVPLIKDSDIQWLNVLDKVDGILPDKFWGNIGFCGTSYVAFICKNCGKRKEWPNACHKKWCPKCNWTLTAERQKVISTWASLSPQCKHVVLTIRNFSDLNRNRIKTFHDSLRRLLRMRFLSSVRGGTLSTEVTNEGKGWHLHCHGLWDADWINPSELAIQWGKQVGQNFGIVHVSDARGKDVAKEVSKYVCKGSELASWTGVQISDFVQSIHSQRFFRAFGSFSKMRKEVKSLIESDGKCGMNCECGCRDFRFKTELTELVEEAARL